MSRFRLRVVLALAVLAVLALIAVLVPLPAPTQLRTWALAAGPAAPILLFLGYSIVTVAPVPRTVFTLAAGLLLGTTTGAIVATGATAVSAILGFGLARSVGRNLVARHLDRSVVKTVDSRLAGGGWLAVASLRLIPVVPFTLLNYCCGLSSVRLLPYLIGTVAGSLPGTLAVVAFGDTLTGAISPASLAISAASAAIGAAGLVITIRRGATRPAPDPVGAGSRGDQGADA